MRKTEVLRLCELLPDPALVVDCGGRILCVNAAASDFFDMGMAGGRQICDVVVTDPPQALAGILAPLDQGLAGAQSPVRVRDGRGGWHDMAACATAAASPVEAVALVVLSRAPIPLESISVLIRENQILRSLVMGAQEAFWCIEFDEPVEITVSADEVIRQVFDNQCHWTMCNPAMGRIYDLPDNVDLNDLPVRTFFHRSPENESFIRGVIDGGYNIDGVPSCDIRHDGTPIFVENSVRCHIENGLLFRMMGSLRDLTPYKRTEIHLAKVEGEIREILSCMSDAVIVFDTQYHLRAANQAFGRIFGVRVENWLGRDIRPLVDFSRHIIRFRANGEDRFVVEGRVPGRSFVRCEAAVSLMSGDNPESFVAVLRPVKR